ncbi:MAG: DUF5919 domain-containing protein [Dermatophilaceae bacterium]
MPPHALFSDARTIRAAGLSLNILCQQLSDSTVLAMIETGTTVECLFLDPNGRAVQEREREEGHGPGYLSTLTIINIQALGRLRQQLPSTARHRLHVRVYDETLRYNLTFVDDSLGVVQPYLHRSRGVDAPAFVFHRDNHRTTGLYPAFDQVYTWLREQSVEHDHN